MDRRKFMAGAGGVILTSQAPAALGEIISPIPDYSCRTTERLTQGPYLTPDSPQRSDIREGVLGIPLKLKLTVINDIWCTPITECVVDVWHCDALGLYSDVENIVFDSNTLAITDDQPIDMRDKKYLRGHQVTDEKGQVEFLTVFPGWYLPRLAHIHVRTIWRDVAFTALDTQLYLPTDIEHAVYQTEPYSTRGPNPIDIAKDLVMKGDVEATRSLTVALEKDGDGFAGEFTIAATSLG
jgi:protocatechuate 3,4-dioxygenase beta subunit